MKKSLSFRFFLVTLAVVVLSITTTITVTMVLLDKVYISYKKDIMIDTYEAMDKYAKSNSVADYDAVGEIARKNSMVALLSVDIDVAIEKANTTYSTNSWIIMENDKQKVLDYDILKVLEPGQLKIIVKDSKTNDGTKEMTLYGRTFDGQFAIIRTPIKSILDISRITNALFIRIGIVAALISAGIIYFITKKETRPILEVAAIAKEMSRMDFSKKYICNRTDEVGVLGNSINTLSLQLEKKISDLKTANLMLQKDLIKRDNIDELRRSFLSNISHELKTPIALIQGYAEGLKENIIADEDRQYYYDVILDESEKMGQLVKRIMALMQLEGGQDQILIRHFDIDALIRQELEKNKIIFEQKGANIKYASNKESYVWADELFIEDVIRNYISNAINHVSKDGIIEVRVEELEEITKVSVFNTGEHIPEEDIDKIWDSFYKVDKARTREYGGTGIGLAVVAAIMKAHDMPYGVNNVDGGVEFYIELDNKM